MEHVLKALSGWLVEHNAIEPGDRELYEYAMYSFLVSVMPLAIFLIVSGLMGLMTEGLLIVTNFMVTRKFSGGYHARHMYTCLIISVGLLSICFYVVTHVNCSWIIHILVVINGLSIAMNSPIDSDNKKLMKDEIRQYKYITCLIVSITMLIYIVLLFMQAERYAICLAVSLVLSSLLQLPCILKKNYLNVFDQN